MTNPKTNDAGSLAMTMPENTSNDTNPITSYIVTLEPHPNGVDLLLPIPEPIMEQLEWTENTQLEFEITDTALILRTA